MNEILKYHSEIERINISKDILFINTKSFVLEETGKYAETESLLLEGFKIDSTNVWLQHIYAHICFDTNQIMKSIEFLKNFTHTWIKKNEFLSIHIKWHYAIAHLESNNNQLMLVGNSLIDEIILSTTKINDTEFSLAILGYIMRLYFRGHAYIFPKWIKLLISFISKKEFYVKHWINDVYAIWLLSHININKDLFNQITEISDGLMTEILAQIDIHIDLYQCNETKVFLCNTYKNIILAMILLGKNDYETALIIFKKYEKNIIGLGGSDEQRILVYEAIIYCALKADNKDYAKYLKMKYFPLGYTNNLLLEI